MRDFAAVSSGLGLFGNGSFRTGRYALKRNDTAPRSDWSRVSGGVGHCPPRRQPGFVYNKRRCVCGAFDFPDGFQSAQVEHRGWEALL